MIIFGKKIFKNCIEELSAFNSAEVYSVLEKIEQLKQTKYVVGYVRYEAAKVFAGEEITSNKPLLWFQVYDKFDKFQNEAPQKQDLKLNVSPCLPFSEYNKAIETIKKNIKAGNTYEVNYTFDHDVKSEMLPFELFQNLLKVQQTPYCAFIENDFEKILSFSPELFFEIKNNTITTKPMKGTIELGKTKGIDNKIILENDTKNRAENLMIVDLLRNDLGRICEIGSVKVPKLFDVEKYSTLYQMTSTIQGYLRDNVTLCEIFEALFPCGSITGAPKIETMKIIDEIEKGSREVYCGAIGYFSPEKTLFSVPIRILQKTNSEDSWKYRVGGGIVWDSTAESEWSECSLKTSFLTKNVQPDFKILETMLCENGQILFEKEHLERMQASAAYLGYDFKPEITFDKSKDSMIRLLLNQNGKIELEYKDISQIKSSEVKISSKKLDSTNAFLRHKTTYRPWYNEAFDEIHKGNILDILFFNEKDELCEGARSNVFLEIDGQLYTPPLNCGLLNGVLRQDLLNNKKCSEKVLNFESLKSASAIYCGNSVRGLVKVNLVL